MKKYNIENINDEFNNRGYDLISKEYVNVTEKLTYICRKHIDIGEQKISYDKFRQGRGCKYCGRESMRKKQSLTFEYVLAEFNKRDMTLLENEYINANTKMKFICNKHKEHGVQEITYGHLMYKRGCKYCSYDELSNKLKHSYDYVKNKFQEKGLVLISKDYINNETPMKFICKKHYSNGVQSAPFVNLLQGYGCVYCANESTKLKQMISHDEFVEKVNYLHDDVVVLSKYNGMNRLVKYQCKKCSHIWETTAASVCITGTGCPHCCSSKGERLVASILNKLSIKYVTQQKFDGLIGLGCGYLSYDFYIPNYNLLIEFQGKQHYEYVNLFHKDYSDFVKQQKHDVIKRNYATNNGINLLEINYRDYPNKVEEILKNKLFPHYKNNS